MSEAGRALPTSCHHVRGNGMTQSLAAVATFAVTAGCMGQGCMCGGSKQGKDALGHQSGPCQLSGAVSLYLWMAAWETLWSG